MLLQMDDRAGIREITKRQILINDGKLRGTIIVPDRIKIDILYLIL